VGGGGRRKWFWIDPVNDLIAVGMIQQVAWWVRRSSRSVAIPDV